MKRAALALLLVGACHREAETTTTVVTIPTSSASASPSAPVAVASASPSASSPPAAGPAAATVAFDVPTHFKSGGRGVASGVTFTVNMLPKLIVAGPEPEIEQAQIDCARGTEHGVIQVDTRHKRAEWGGLIFEFGYGDVYHDDIELTVRRK